jgi:raffinose/stachyose/melibiose transport system substrate-binding protein
VEGFEMNKRVLSVLLVIVMLALSVIGCTSKPSSDAPSVSSEKTGSEKETDGESKLSGTIVYWSMWQETEPQANILKNEITRFEDANPDCKVDVEWKGRGIKDLILPALEVGTEIDIFDTDPNNLYKADSSKLLKLDDFFASPSAQGQETVKQSLLEGLVNFDEELGESVGLSGYHSVPYSPYVVSWFYNKEHFAKAGIDKTPTTWAELEVVCEKLVEAGYTPITIDDAYMTLLFSYYMQRAVGSKEAIALSDNQTATAQAWDNPILLQMMKDFENFASKGYFSKFIDTNIYPAGQAEFALGNASMTVNGSWFPTEVANMTGEDFQWGEFAYPTVAGGVAPITENTIGGQAFMVNSATENKEGAFELLRYFVSNETQQEFMENGLVPCTNNADWPAEVSEQKEIVSNLTKNVQWAAGVETDFGLSVILTEITKIIGGNQSGQDGLANIKKVLK